MYFLQQSGYLIWNINIKAQFHFKNFDLCQEIQNKVKPKLSRSIRARDKSKGDWKDIEINFFLENLDLTKHNTGEDWFSQTF